MPIILPAGGTPSADPVSMSSGDGHLDGKFLPALSGVMLRGDFGQSSLYSQNFEASTVDGWVAAYATDTVAQTTSGPLAGAKSLLITSSVFGNRGAKKVFASPFTGGRAVRLAYKIRMLSGYVRIMASDNQGTWHDAIFPAPGTATRSWFEDLFIPIDRTLKTLQIIGVNVNQADAMLLDDISLTAKACDSIAFERSDGTRVRGGDTAASPGGVAYAYDDELTPGEVALYTAIPVWAGKLGSPSAPVFFNITDPPTSIGSTFLKSLEDPALSVNVMVDWTEYSMARAITAAGTPRGLPVAAANSDYVFSGTIDMITIKEEDIPKMLALMSQLVLYLQVPGKYHKPCMYVVPVAFKVRDFARMDAPEKTWEVTLQQVQRPPTLGQPSIIPSSTYADLTEAYASYTALAATGMTYRQLIWGS